MVIPKVQKVIRIIDSAISHIFNFDIPLFSSFMKWFICFSSSLTLFTSLNNILKFSDIGSPHSSFSLFFHLFISIFTSQLVLLHHSILFCDMHYSFGSTPSIQRFINSLLSYLPFYSYIIPYPYLGHSDYFLKN